MYSYKDLIHLGSVKRELMHALEKAFRCSNRKRLFISASYKHSRLLKQNHGHGIRSECLNMYRTNNRAKISSVEAKSSNQTAQLSFQKAFLGHLYSWYYQSGSRIENRLLPIYVVGTYQHSWGRIARQNLCLQNRFEIAAFTFIGGWICCSLTFS